MLYLLVDISRASPFFVYNLEIWQNGRSINHTLLLMTNLVRLVQLWEDKIHKHFIDITKLWDFYLH